MGNNYCSGRRDKLGEAGRYSNHMMQVYKTEMAIKYHDIKDDAREKYEDARFHYKAKKQQQELT